MLSLTLLDVVARGAERKPAAPGLEVEALEVGVVLADGACVGGACVGGAAGFLRDPRPPGAVEPVTGPSAVGLSRVRIYHGQFEALWQRRVDFLEVCRFLSPCRFES